MWDTREIQYYAKKYIRKIGYYVTWEVVLFIIFICAIIYVHYKFAKKDEVYSFRGLTDEEIFEEVIMKDTEIRIPPSSQGKTKKKKSKKWKFEERCREILESIYHKKFPSVRPDFLRSPVTNKNLELDCYCESLKIAVEYDGKQHAEYTPHFHRNDKWKFIYQVRKDDWKNKRCEELGITLIRVPHHIKFDKLESYIRKKLIKAGKL